MTAVLVEYRVNLQSQSTLGSISTGLRDHLGTRSVVVPLKKRAQPLSSVLASRAVSCPFSCGAPRLAS